MQNPYRSTRLFQLATLLPEAVFADVFLAAIDAASSVPSIVLKRVAFDFDSHNFGSATDAARDEFVAVVDNNSIGDRTVFDDGAISYDFSYAVPPVTDQLATDLAALAGTDAGIKIYNLDFNTISSLVSASTNQALVIVTNSDYSTGINAGNLVGALTSYNQSTVLEFDYVGVASPCFGYLNAALAGLAAGSDTQPDSVVVLGLSNTCGITVPSNLVVTTSADGSNTYTLQQAAGDAADTTLSEDEATFTAAQGSPVADGSTETFTFGTDAPDTSVLEQFISEVGDPTMQLKTVVVLGGSLSEGGAAIFLPGDGTNGNSVALPATVQATQATDGSITITIAASEVVPEAAAEVQPVATPEAGDVETTAPVAEDAVVPDNGSPISLVSCDRLPGAVKIFDFKGSDAVDTTDLLAAINAITGNDTVLVSGLDADHVRAVAAAVTNPVQIGFGIDPINDTTSIFGVDEVLNTLGIISPDEAGPVTEAAASPATSFDFTGQTNPDTTGLVASIDALVAGTITSITVTAPPVLALPAGVYSNDNGNGTETLFYAAPVAGVTYPTIIDFTSPTGPADVAAGLEQLKAGTLTDLYVSDVDTIDQLNLSAVDFSWARTSEGNVVISLNPPPASSATAAATAAEQGNVATGGQAAVDQSTSQIAQPAAGDAVEQQQAAPAGAVQPSAAAPVVTLQPVQPADGGGQQQQ